MSLDLTRLRNIVCGEASRGAAPAGPPGRVAASVPPRRELTYEPVDADGQPLDLRHGLPSFPGAAWHDTPHGAIVVVDTLYPAEFLHGRVPVEEIAVWDPATVAIVNGRPIGERPPAAAEAGQDGPIWRRSPVFFDLETTGLSGGAGTVPFLVGCGYFDDGAFRTRQFFLHGFAAERALLHAVTAFLDGIPLLVTYNGRTFDVPVMETRWLFHRMPVALENVPHVDMLPPSRRLWRESADHAETSCRLVALEQLLCGVIRVGDVPGMEIPQRYFEYVRQGDPRLLEPVLYHNRMDLLSLAALAARAQRLVRDGADGALEPAECLALGRFLERRGDRTEAERCYRRTIADVGASDRQREDALHALALLLRRTRRYQEAAAVWQRLLAVGIGRTTAVREAVEALAIHHEHRERDLQRARGLALRALSTERDPRRREAVTYRLARLERKLARARPPDSQPSLIGADPISIHASAAVAEFWGVTAAAPGFSRVLDEKLAAAPGGTTPRRAAVPPRPAPWQPWIGTPGPVMSRPVGAAVAQAYGQSARPPAGMSTRPDAECSGPARPPVRRLRVTTARERDALATLRRLGATGLGPDLADVDLKRAFRQLARRYHPDARPDSDPGERRRLARLFADACDAYRLLIESAA